MNDISLRRFLVEDLEIESGFCVIMGREAHHMSRVLRMGRGDALVLLDGKGERFLAEIQSVSRDAVKIQIKKSIGHAPPSALEITLFQAVIKSASMDYLIQKTSELGVTRISPFFSSRSVVRLKGDRQRKKINRWREIAHSAAKQCDRDIPAEIRPPESFEKQLVSFSKAPGLKVILWERETSRDLKDLLQKHEPSGDFTGMVGPEGGFTPEEVSTAQRAGFIPVSMGSRILRAETASLVLVAIVQYEWGDLRMG
ncbi:MAG: 16S rRNA (uracil(1498)-N(3))-methyltransferase [Deltaproteobacteria bacterium]|nr:16S rRNA (uracil(1498)-N(3))-methyltransferase [Deltaproteobacteria bacterium]